MKSPRPTVFQSCRMENIGSNLKYILINRFFS